MLKNTVIDTGSMKFTFTDTDGDVFAWFKLNPTDPRLLNKCKEMESFFKSASEKRMSFADFEVTVENKFSEFLGYDCRKSLFGRIAATDILSDGRTFAAHILDVMIEHVGPEIQKRRDAQKAKYTEKYSK